MAAITSAGSGNWSSTTPNAPWPSGIVPTTGDTVTISSGHTITLDIDVTGLGAITSLAGTLTWSTLGKTLSLAGNITQVSTGTMTFGPGGVLEFDNVGRTWTITPGFGNPSPVVQTSGTSASSRFTVRTASGGTNAKIVTSVNRWFVAFGLSYVDFVRIGDASNDCLQIDYQSATGKVATFTGCTFTACGRVNMLTSPVASSGWTFSACAWTGSPGTNTLVTRGSVTPSASRSVDSCVFDKPPSLGWNGSSYTRNYFHRGFARTGAAASALWASFDGNFVRQDAQTGYEVGGPYSNNVWVVDTPSAPAATGAATSATASTLTDSGAAWGTDGFAADGTDCWCCYITGGTGAGQCRSVQSNTSTTLTLRMAWDVTPDATSTYAIVEHVANPHQTRFSQVPASSTCDVTDSAWYNGGADDNGECLSALTVSTATTNCRWNLFLRNAALSNSGDICSLDNTAGTLVCEHNTFFAGGQSMILHSDGAATSAGRITSLKSNLCVADPAKTNDYLLSGQGSGAALGPYVIADVVNYSSPGSGTANVVTSGEADYNGTHGLKTGYALKGYHSNLTTPGAHDVSGDPQFVDAARTPLTWAVSVGATASPSQVAQMAALLAHIQADTSRTKTLLLPYLRAGFAPTNTDLRDAGHDGVTIGAVEGVFGGGGTGGGKVCRISIGIGIGL